MLGLLFLLLAFLTGYSLTSLLLPDLFAFTDRDYRGNPIKAPSFLIVIPSAMLIGTLVLSWTTYIIACVFSSAESPLAYANGIVMPASIAFIIGISFFKRKQIKNQCKTLFINTKSVDCILIIVVLLIASSLMIGNFYYTDGSYHISNSVYYDFSIHLSMIRSFSKGFNFPTEYSFFAGEDIKYHFMYEYLVGNLEYLGLRLDHAFNIPSIIFFANISILLYLLAIKITSKRSVGLLTVFLSLFRSGSAFIVGLIKNHFNFKEFDDYYTSNLNGFLGMTDKEGWGIYDMIALVNQRHLTLGICTILFAVMIFLPYLYSAEHKKQFFSKQLWVPSGIKMPITVGMIVGMTSFFNGACVIACLIILFIMALFSIRKTEYLITAVITVVLTYIQSLYFIKEGVISFSFNPGYLAYDKDPISIITFIILLFGPFIFLLIAAAVKSDTNNRIAILAFFSPIIFAMTFQITTEVVTSHKFIMIGVMLCDVFVASILIRMLSKKSVLSITTSAILIVLSTITGLYNTYLLYRFSSYYTTMKANTPITEWIWNNSDSNDIYLTYEYSLSEETLAGAMLYFAYPPYARDAGYDVDYRMQQVVQMYEATTSEQLDELCATNNIRFIIVDNKNRESEYYSVNEENIASTYECVFSYEEDGNLTNIYDTEMPIYR